MVELEQPAPATAEPGEPAAADSALTLHAALHLRIEPPFAPGLPLPEQVDLLARCIGAQLLRAWAAAGVDAREPQDIVLSSTVLSGAITGDTPMAERLLQGIRAVCGHRPLAILHTYMCTGWAFGLRFMAHHTRAPRLSVVIVDVDVHDFRFRRAHAPIGQFGFGLTTAVLSFPARRHEAVACGGPYAGSAFNELIRGIKASHALGRPHTTFVPYLREDMIHIVRRVLGEEGLAPNRYPEYGHCFGADTWIGVIEHLQSGTPLTADRAVTMGAIAFNGYYCVARVRLRASTATGFGRTAGDAGALQAHATHLQPSAQGPR